ncbi:sperm-specific sodium:proton exchanger-like [Amblyomma americanum]
MLLPKPPDYEFKLFTLCCVVIIASVSRMLSLAWRLPKVVVSVACGLVLGALAGPDAGTEASSIPVYASMYVPAVTYTVTIQAPYHELCSCAVTCLVLGSAGFLIAAMLNGLTLYALRQLSTTFYVRDLVFTSLLMAYQEPMVISDVITHSPFKARILETVLAGEALVSTSLFLFWEVVDSNSDSISATRVVTWFAWFVLGSLVLGKVVGHVMAYVLDHLHYEATLMCSLSLASVYVTYYLADLFMFRGGMLGVIAMGLTMKACATSAAMTDEEPFLRFWSTYRYVLAVLLVFLASMRVGRELSNIRSYRPVYMPTVYCFVRLSNRVITVVVLFPVLKRTGYHLTGRQALVLAWLSLKGPVAMVSLSTRAMGTLVYKHTVAERLARILAVVEANLIPAFTISPLMKNLGLLKLDAPESARVRHSIKSIWEAATRSRQRQRSRQGFSGADWKWIEERIYLADMLSLGYQLHSGQPQTEAIKPAPAKQPPRKLSDRLNRITKVVFKDDTDHMGSSFCVVPSRGNIIKVYKEINRNIRTIQRVSFRRQFENGMIHPETYVKIMTALYMSHKDDSYLDLPAMRKLLYLPSWVFSFKEKVLSALPEPSERTSSTSASKWGSELLSPSQVVSNRLRRAHQCVLLNVLAALSMGAALAGVLLAALEHHSPLFTTASVALQGCILLLHSAELVTMYARSPSASFLVVDALARMDLGAYLLQLGLFCVAAWCSAVDLPLRDCRWPVTLFIVLTAFRAHKFWSLRRVISEACLRYMDQAINHRVFRMYDMAVAFINSEEEVLSTGSMAPNEHISVFMREEVRNNKIELLKELIRIQQRYPSLECVARSRLIARRIVNSSRSALNDLHESGLVERHHYTELGTRLEQMIRDLNRLPSSVSVPETTLSFLLSVPWLPGECVPRLKMHYCARYNKGKKLVSSGKPHQAIHIIFSGIVRIEATDRCPSRRPPVLANSDSLQFFSGEGPLCDFLVGPGSLGIVGFLTKGHSVCDVICETDIEVCAIPRPLMETLVARDDSSPCILYRMWHWVAVRIALNLLEARDEFESVDPDALQRYVEDGRLPYLGRTSSLVLDDDVDCAVLVQGTMYSSETGRRAFHGPQFVPESVRCLDISGDPERRPLPVLLLLCKQRYRLPNELDWQNMPGELFSTEAAEHWTRQIASSHKPPSTPALAPSRR